MSASRNKGQRFASCHTNATSPNKDRRTGEPRDGGTSLSRASSLSLMVRRYLPIRWAMTVSLPPIVSWSSQAALSPPPG